MIALDCGGSWLQRLTCEIGKFLGDVVGGLIEKMFQPILDALAEACTTLFGTIGTFWIYVDTPAVGSTSNGAPASDTVAWIWSHTQYIAVAVATIGVMVAGIQMAFTQRGEAIRDLLRSLITLAVASALAIAVVQVLIEFGDQFANCIVTTALTDSGQGWTCGRPGTGDSDAFGTTMAALVGISATAGGLGIGLMITVAILTVIASVIQIVLMVVRTAMLILLVGVLPIAAAATNTEMGKSWFKRIISWLVAFVLYKPVAALIYATAIRLTSNNGRGLNFTGRPGEGAGPQIMNTVTGITMLVLALFALPALMRFIAPMVAATAGSAGAGAMAAKLVGADKIADKASESAQSESSGPSGSRNVPRSSQQSSSPSGSGNPSPQPSGSSGGSSGGGGGGSTGTASTGTASTGTASTGTASTGTASTGAATTTAAGAGTAGGAASAGAAAGPVGIAVVAAAAAVKKGVDMTKEAAQAGASETINNDAMDEGPSGSG